MTKSAVLKWVFRSLGYLCVIMMMVQLFLIKEMQNPNIVMEVGLKVVPFVIGFYFFKIVGKKFNASK